VTGLSRCRRATERESGAVAVEFALLLPVAVVMIFGMISAGFGFERWISVTQGTREASRFAATLSVAAGGGTADAWLREVADRAIAASGVDVDATHADPGTTVCVALVSPTNYPTVNRHMNVTTDSAGVLAYAASDGACPGVGTPTGDYVQVRVTTPTDFNYIAASATSNFHGTGVSMYEAAASAPETP
jgi:Flp pilus assembly protein TadG